MSIGVIACGTQNPLGTWTSMSAANIRAGIAKMSFYPNFIDREWEQVQVAMAEYIEPHIPNMLRFLKLAEKALEEAIVPLDDLKLNFPNIPIHIGIPSKRDGLHLKLEEKLAKLLQETASKHQINLVPKFYSQGHASGLIGMKDAFTGLLDEEAEFYLVGGVESYIHPQSIGWLEDHDYLKCSHNKSGFIPGEGAGFCLVSTPDTAQKYGLMPLIEILSVSSADEPNHNGSGGICLGEGLTGALQTVFESLEEGEQVSEIYCDFNGQRYRADEYGYSVMRLNRFFKDPSAISAPAGFWGDLGAATAPMLIGLASESARKGYNKGKHALIFTGSLEEHRAAALLNLKPD